MLNGRQTSTRTAWVILEMLTISSSATWSNRTGVRGSVASGTSSGEPSDGRKAVDFDTDMPSAVHFQFFSLLLAFRFSFVLIQQWMHFASSSAFSLILKFTRICLREPVRDRLEGKCGITLLVSFEHEFYYSGAVFPPSFIFPVSSCIIIIVNQSIT